MESFADGPFRYGVLQKNSAGKLRGHVEQTRLRWCAEKLKNLREEEDDRGV